MDAYDVPVFDDAFLSSLNTWNLSWSVEYCITLNYGDSVPDRRQQSSSDVQTNEYSRRRFVFDSTNCSALAALPRSALLKEGNLAFSLALSSRSGFAKAAGGWIIDMGNDLLHVSDLHFRLA